MSEILLLFSLRFRCGAEQERGTGACGRLNLSLILLVSGCCMGTAVRNRINVCGWSSILPPTATALLPMPTPPPAAAPAAVSVPPPARAPEIAPAAYISAD
jgi:hypothetical protein